MTTFLLCLGAALALACNAIVVLPMPAEVQHQFAVWKALHNKTYATKHEENLRLSNFYLNQQEIAKLNARHQGKPNSAKFGLNKFADLSKAELKRLRGFRGEAAAEMRASTTVAPVIPNPSPPSSVDWRTKDVVSPVQDQAQCGSCWAFSATANIESQWAISKKSTPIKLSEQCLVDCDHECGQYRGGEDGCDQGCSGGLMPNAFQYVMKNGQATEESYSYTGSDGSCKTFTPSSVKVSNWTMISQDEAQMAAWVAENGVASIAVGASEWSFYMGGIMEYLCFGKYTYSDLDHGVAIVGYGTEDGTDYWIIRNSWGASWGENGYARILRGTGFCGVNLFACSAVI